MSIKVMASIWEHSRERGTALLMLLAIADNANEYGEAWPSVDHLAEKCRMKRRNAQLLLKELEGSGELLIARQEGANTPHGKTNMFTVVTPGALSRHGVQSSTPHADRGATPYTPGVQNSVTRGAKFGSDGVQSSTPRTISEPSLTTNDVAAALKSVGMTGKQRRDILEAQPDLTPGDVAAWQSFRDSPPPWCDKPEGYIYRRLLDADAPPLERTNGNQNMTEEEKNAKYMADFYSKPVSPADYRSR